MQRQRIVLFPTITFLLFLLVAPSHQQAEPAAGGQEEQELVLSIDGCVVAQQAQQASKKKVTITLAFGNESSTNSSSGASSAVITPPTTYYVRFNNCMLEGIDISIAISPQPKETSSASTKDDNSWTGDLSNSVRIEVVNTTMLGCLLEIVPTATDEQEPPEAQHQRRSLLSLRHIFVFVRNATLHGVGDVLVVKTTTTSTQVMSIDNVRLRLYDVVLTSSSGSVASICTHPTDASSSSLSFEDEVSRANIHIGGNTSLEAKYLVASVRTSKLTHSTLLVEQLTTSSSGTRSPIQLVAGGSSVDGYVGVLSVFPSSTRITHKNGTALHVENIRIGAIRRSTFTTTSGTYIDGTSGGGPLTMVADVRAGVAAVATIAARHVHKALITLAGNVTIHLALDGDEVASSAASSTEHHQSSTSSTMGVVLSRSSFQATAQTYYSIAAIGSVALLTYSSSLIDTSTEVLLADGCNLHLQLDIGGGGATIDEEIPISPTDNTGRSDDGSQQHRSCALIESTVVAGYSISTVLSVTSHSLASSNSECNSSNSVSIQNRSSLGIQASIGNADVLVASTGTGGYLVSTIFGMSMLSYSHKQSSGNSLSISDGSNVTVGFSSTSSSNVSIMMFPLSGSAANQRAYSILGVAMSCRSSTNSTNTITIRNESSLSMGSSFGKVSGARDYQGCTDAGSGVTLQLQPGGQHLATALAGLALQSHSLQGSSINAIVIHKPSALNIVIAGSSNTSSCSANFLSRTSGAQTAVAVFGVSSNSGSSVLTVSKTSTLRIYVLLANSGTVLVATKSLTSPAAVAGVFLNGQEEAIVSLQQEKEDDTEEAASATRKQIEVWVGLQNGSTVSVTPQPFSKAGVALGLVAEKDGLWTGVNGQNTVLALCRDEASNPPLAVGGGIAMNTSPLIDSVNVTETVGWHLEQEQSSSFSSSSSASATTTASSSLSSCSGNATMLHSMLTELLKMSFWAPPSSHPAHNEDGVISPSQTTPTPSVSVLPTTRTHSQTSITASLQPLSSTHTMTHNGASRSVTVSRNPLATASPPQTNTSSPALSPPPPPPPKRTVATSVLLPDNEAAATVVLSTASASNAVASTLGSGGAGVVVVAGSSVRLMECGLAEDDPKPATFELPIQFAVGNGMMQYFAGAVLAHTLLQCALLATPILLRRRLKSKGLQPTPTNNLVQYSAMLFCGAHAFFTPAILGACSTVLNNDDDTVALCVAAGSALVIVAIHAAVVLAVHRGPENGLVARSTATVHGQNVKLEFDVRSATATTSTSSTSSSSDENESDSDNESSSETTTGGSFQSVTTGALGPPSPVLFSAQATKDILLTLFDGCRIYEKASHRHYASIETTIFSIIAVISGARPQQNCSSAAFAVGALAALQLLYILLIRPYRTKLDMLFSVLNATILVMLCLAVAISLQQNHEGSPADNSWTIKLIEACLWLISVLGFVQLGVQGYWAYHVQQRRRHRLHNVNQHISSDDDSEGTNPSNKTDSLDEPLLVAVELSERRPGHNSNPLAKRET